MFKFLPPLRSTVGRVAGFTMIELLIVITILGILATAVLSAINPLEQINRGRDTAAQSDAEQYLNAIERFNAFQERFPWETPGTAARVGDGNGTGVDAGGTWLAMISNGSSWATNSNCSVLDLLGSGTVGVTGCAGTNEVKSSYVTKLEALEGDRVMSVYKEDDTTASNLYVCFLPQSNAFRQKAIARCTDAPPADFPMAMACPNVDADKMICLP